MKIRYHNVTFFGLIFTLTIICYHNKVSATPTNKLDVFLFQALQSTTNQMAVFAMTSFFLVSAYFFFRKLTDEDYLSKLFKRFKTLLIPYIFWQFLYCLTISLQQGKWFPFSILAIFNFQHFPYNGPLWYLNGLILLFIGSYLLLQFYKMKLSTISKFLIIFSLYLVVTYLTKRTGLENYMGYLNNIFTYAPGFIMGSFLGYFDLSDKELNHLEKIMLFAFILNIMIFNAYQLSFIYTILVVYIMSAFEVSEKTVSHGLFKLPFIIYANQIILINLLMGRVNGFLSRFLGSATLQFLISQIFFMFLSIFVAFLIRYVIRKSTILNQIVTGGRS